MLVKGVPRNIVHCVHILQTNTSVRSPDTTLLFPFCLFLGNMEVYQFSLSLCNTKILQVAKSFPIGKDLIMLKNKTIP